MKTEAEQTLIDLIVTARHKKPSLWSQSEGKAIDVDRTRTLFMSGNKANYGSVFSLLIELEGSPPKHTTLVTGLDEYYLPQVFITGRQIQEKKANAIVAAARTVAKERGLSVFVGRSLGDVK